MFVWYYKTRCARLHVGGAKKDQQETLQGETSIFNCEPETF